MTSLLKSRAAQLPSHDMAMAAQFLAILDPTARNFTFQFFSDGADRFAEIVHGPLDDVWPRICALNTTARQIGVFVTINKTDLRGRRQENIVGSRALFVDADNAEQVRRCEELVKGTGITPTMVVRTSADRAHFYWCCDDLVRDDFEAWQAALIEKFGTDPAVKDLSRVMRLPGTLHLKNANYPQLVTLETTGPVRRWTVRELGTEFALSITPGGYNDDCGGTSLAPADSTRLRRLFGVDCLVTNDLAAGLETNIEEIRSAVTAIPPSAIATEPEWVKLARGLAYEARIYIGQATELWEILDSASAVAPNYNQAENQQRWLRYINEAQVRQRPITIATVFDMARRHGWMGWSPHARPAGAADAKSLTVNLNVSFKSIPHRRWLYGVDLVRGEITLLAAPGGVGKSSLAIGMSTSAAIGRRLLDEKIWSEGLKVFYVNAEDSGIEMRRRIWAFCLNHGVAEQELGRLLVAGADDWRVQKLSFLRTDKGASVLDDNGIAFLESLLEQLKPDAVVLDPLVALCGGGNLNDNAAMALVMRALKRLATKFDCAFLILHHTRKGGDLSSAEAIGGASAIVNLSRRALMAVPMTVEEAPRLGLLPSERSAYFKITASKSNLAPRSDDGAWYKLCSITLPNSEPPTYPSGDGVQAVKRVSLPLVMNAAESADQQKILRAILDVVGRGKVVGGEIVPYSPTVTGAKNERALIDDAMAAVQAATAPRTWLDADLRAATTRAIASLKSAGALVEEEIKGGRFRRGRGLKVARPQRPCADEKSDCAPGDANTIAAEAGPPNTGLGGQLVNGVVND
jgi:AAA domain/RepB DNA-primase from phage plasmid/Primase C terminal 2 (PriCT-2)